MNKSKLKLRALTEGAIFVALAVVVGKLKLFELPQGGSIWGFQIPCRFAGSEPFRELEISRYRP